LGLTRRKGTSAAAQEFWDPRVRCADLLQSTSLREVVRTADPTSRNGLGFSAALH